MSILFTATYPEQVTALILGSAAARWFPAPDYPCGDAAVAMYESLRDIAAHHWGRGDTIEWYLPSRAADPHARELFARFERLAVTPGAFLRMTAMIREIDVRAALPAVHVPTLVVHRLSDRITPPFHGRYLAERIAGARYFEQPGDHSLRFAGGGDSDALFGEIAGFLAPLLGLSGLTTACPICHAHGVQREAMSQHRRTGSRSRPASIRDVARLAGVSHQTVSRVLNGHPSVRDATRTRVLVAMDELQFRPSRAARMLSMRRSQTIGVLAAAVGSHYGPASSVSAVEDAAREQGYYATVAHLASLSADAISAAVEDLLNQDVEGVVIVAPRTAVLSRLAALAVDIPIVAAQGEQEDAGGIPVASVDQRAGVRMMMDYLTGQGHRRIVHVAGPPDWNDAQSRLRAYEAELRSSGLPVLPPVHGDWTAESGYQAGRSLIQAAGHGELGFSAVFSSNDQMALGLMHAFREAGLDVPRDVSVAGFDDIPEAAHFWPPLTTVRQAFDELGKRCVAMLMDAIRKSEDPSAVPDEAVPDAVPPQLVVRDSVAAV